MIEFKYYLDKGEVKKVRRDVALAKSLINNLSDREKMVLKYSLKDALIIYENLYDCLREICDALLALDEYKSYSHQASITYLRKYGFDEVFVKKLDDFQKQILVFPCSLITWPETCFRILITSWFWTLLIS